MLLFGAPPTKTRVYSMPSDSFLLQSQPYSRAAASMTPKVLRDLRRNSVSSETMDQQTSPSSHLQSVPARYRQRTFLQDHPPPFFPVRKKGEPDPVTKAMSSCPAPPTPTRVHCAPSDTSSCDDSILSHDHMDNLSEDAGFC